MKDKKQPTPASLPNGRPMAGQRRCGKLLKPLLSFTLVMIMTVAMALSLTSCGDTSWAADIEGTRIPAGVYIQFLMQARADAEEQMTEEDTDLWSKTFEDKNAEQWIKDQAMEMCKQYVAVEKKFDELGLQFSEDDTEQLEYQLQVAWEQYGESFYEKNGVARSSLRLVYENQIKRSLVFDKYYETNGLDAVAEADIQKYYTDNYARVKYIQMPLTDGEGNKLKSEGKKQFKEEVADKLFARAQQGEDFDQLIDEFTAYRDELEAEANASSSSETSTSSDASTSSSSTTSSETSTSSDASTSSTSSSDTASGEEEEEDPYVNEKIFKKGTTGSYEKVISFIFSSAKENEPIFYEEDDYYYIILRLPIMERKELYDDNRRSILMEIKGDEFVELVDGWCKDYRVELNSDSYKRYSPKKIVYPQTTTY